MSKISVIPKILFEQEDIVTLTEKGIKFEDGYQKIGKTKIRCLKFYNMSECEVFDTLDGNSLLESVEAEKNTFASRCIAIIFMRMRSVQSIQDPDLRIAASCSLLSAICALATINVKSAQRFLPLVRQI